MWITPRVIQGFVKDVFWNKLAEASFLQLLKHKSTGTFLDGLISTTVRMSTVASSPLTYRIVLRNPRDGNTYIIAVSDSEEVIRRHWDHLLITLIPQVHSSKERGDVTEDDELVQFLLSKVASLAQLEEGEEVKNVENVIKEFHTHFKSLNEKMMTYFLCTLWQTFPKNGTLFLTENYICFYSGSFSVNLVIPFKDITSMTKESFAMGMLDNSIKITTSSQQHFFSFIKREEVYVLMERLWKQAMQRILAANSVEDSQSFPGIVNRPSDSLSSKKVLDDNMKNEVFQNKFKLFDEEYIKDFVCSFWWKSSYVVGKMYISSNFIAFESNVAIATKEIQVVIAITDIQNIEKKSSFGLLQNGMNITTRIGQQLFFALYSIKDALELIQNLIRTKSSENREKFAKIEKTISEGWELDNIFMIELDRKEEEKQRQLWGNYFAKHGRGISIVKTPRLRLILREGIPNDMRGEMWCVLSGARARLLAKPSYYENILREHESQTSGAIEDIEKDIHRALPNHPFFSAEGSGVEKLRRVLTAFSWRNPTIGYCQSMNIIAAALLLYMNEENAFWMMCTICENLVPEYYDKSLLGSQVDQYIFTSLVSNNLTDINDALDRLGLPLNLISLPWFMCLFLTYVPWHAALRLLDCFFYDGPNVLLQAGLAILKLNEKEICSEEDSERVMNLLRSSDYDCQLLMRSAFTDFGFLPLDKIRELRNRQKFHAIRQMEDAKKKRVIQQLEDQWPKFNNTELDDVYDKFKSVLSPSSPEFTIDLEQCQQLFEFYLKEHAPWWNSVLPRLYLMTCKSLDGKMDFGQFVNILGIAKKGTMEDKFRFCFQICDTNSDGLISKEELGRLLGILHKMYFKEDKTRDFSDFIEMAFIKANRVSSTEDIPALLVNDNLTCDALVDVIIKKPLIFTYWSLTPEPTHHSNLRLSMDGENELFERLGISENPVQKSDE